MFISMGLQLLIKAPVTAIWAVTKILNKNISVECSYSCSSYNFISYYLSFNVNSYAKI